MTHTQVYDSSLTDTLTDPLWLSHPPLTLLTDPLWIMTHPLTVQPLTLPHRHLAPLYISQPSGYLVAPVLTWLPSHTFCAITSWILPVHPLVCDCHFIATCPFLESLRALFAEYPLST